MGLPLTTWSFLFYDHHRCIEGAGGVLGHWTAQWNPGSATDLFPLISLESRNDEPACGRPLGIRAGPNGTLFVADAYKGLFEVNPWTRM